MSEELPIETGIPIPPDQPRRKGLYATTLRAMKPGDSFVVPAYKLPNLYVLCRRNGWGIEIRSLDYDIEGGRAVRVWKKAKRHA